MVQIKRAYSQPSPHDGVRILVDRLWPRGCTKEQLRLDAWRKDLAPSTALRKWFGHDPRKWAEFSVRYRKELEQPELRNAIDELAKLGRKQTITLIFSATDTTHNQAMILKELIDDTEG